MKQRKKKNILEYYNRGAYQNEGAYWKEGAKSNHYGMMSCEKFESKKGKIIDFKPP